MKTTRYYIDTGRFPRELTLAIVADLHGDKPWEVIEILKKERPDYILMPGDIFEDLDGSCDEKNNIAFDVLRESARIAPTFYSCGNHEDGECGAWWKLWRRHEGRERCFSPENTERIQSSGAVYLEDSYTVDGGIAFGGLASGLLYRDKKPKLSWLEEFCRFEGPKVLLCHHPEYFEPYLKELPIDLIVSGHAHGGQWRIFGRGVFAPGQGIFPKYTSGVHHGRFVISRGLKRGGIVPRIFNPREVVIVKLCKEKGNER